MSPNALNFLEGTIDYGLDTPNMETDLASPLQVYKQLTQEIATKKVQLGENTSDRVPPDELRDFYTLYGDRRAAAVAMLNEISIKEAYESTHGISLGELKVYYTYPTPEYLHYINTNCPYSMPLEVGDAFMGFDFEPLNFKKIVDRRLSPLFAHILDQDMRALNHVLKNGLLPETELIYFITNVGFGAHLEEFYGFEVTAREETGLSLNDPCDVWGKPSEISTIINTVARRAQSKNLERRVKKEFSLD